MGEPVRLLRRALPVLSLAVLAAVLYDGWIFYSRWHSAREAERMGRDEETRRARQTVDLIGGAGFRIINFYAAPEKIRRGEKARLCFGVYGAKSLRMEPPVEDLRPAIDNCVEVSPRDSTAYKLIADDGAGHTATANLSITVMH